MRLHKGHTYGRGGRRYAREGGAAVAAALLDAAHEEALEMRRARADAAWHGRNVRQAYRNARFTPADLYYEGRMAARCAFLARPDLRQAPPAPAQVRTEAEVAQARRDHEELCKLLGFGRS